MAKFKVSFKIDPSDKQVHQDPKVVEADNKDEARSFFVADTIDSVEKVSDETEVSKSSPSQPGATVNPPPVPPVPKA